MSAALLRRLGKVESATYDASGERRGGVMKVPPILSLDEWEQIAMRQQAELVAAAREDTEPRLKENTQWPT